MAFKQQTTLTFAAISTLAAMGFLLDLFTPLGVADWVWYFIPLLLSAYVGGRSFPYLLAAVFSAFTLTGYLFSPPWVDTHLAFISRLMGVCVQWLMAFLISQRKGTEAELFKSRQMLRLILDNIPQRVFWKDRYLKYLGCNRHFALDGGYDHPDELVGKSDFETSWKAVAERYRADDQQVLDTGESKLNYGEPQVRLDGKKLWLTTSKSPLVDQQGRIIGVLGTYEDITDRIRVEKQLAESRNYLDKIINSVADPIFVKDRQHCWVLLNDAFCELMGHKREELLGKSDGDFFPKSETDVFWLKDEAVFTTGRENINEEQFTDGHGVTHTIMTKKALYEDEKGEKFIVGIIRDITDRKRTEDALRSANEFNQEVISSVNEGIIVYDRELRYRLWNRFMEQLTGLPAAEVLGKKALDLFPFLREQGVDSLLERALKGETVYSSDVQYHMPRTGKEGWVRGIYGPHRDASGEIAGVIGVVIEMTGRKRAEDNMREQAALLDKARDAILVLDMEDRITYWNKSAERIYGWKAPEAIGKNPLELFLGGALSPQHAAAMKTVNERGEWSGELQEITKDGSTVVVQGRCNIIRDKDGRPQSRLIINTDITERKKLEAQFLRTQRLESLGTLAGGIAHDLNNVLTPLLVSVQILKEKTAGTDELMLLEALETNIKRGACLVKQVLAFGRGITGERITVHPEHVAGEIKQIIRETFPKSIECELHSDADLSTVIGDPTQLQQVLLNLCVNARDAMPHGGRLSIRMENVALDQSCASLNLDARPGAYVLIQVTDTGTGIPKQIQDRIFDPFFTTKEPGKGTGLGLSTTLAIVKSHGGFISCSSEPGKGSTFKVYLPGGAAPACAEKAAVKPSEFPLGNNELVLVVDDEEPIRILAQKVLERYGYRVLLAVDGNEAVSLYRPRWSEIDVVVTDMVMPVLDGPSTIQALRSINPDVKIIGSSGWASDGGVSRAARAGLRHFITKPYTTETMLNTLHEVLNGKN